VRRGIAILGSTGSIGRSALEVVRHHPERLRVVALAARGGQAEALLEQVREFSPRCVAVVEPSAAEWLATRLPAGVRLLRDGDGLAQAATAEGVERVLAAMVGAAGLPAVYAAVSAGKDLALANKEALVVGGRVLTEAAARHGVLLLPVDSEHAALHQALRGGRAEEVRRLVLTASGGPFRTRPRETWDSIRPEEALRHPTWSMGAKITVDSATLMNKALELIEAHHFFAMAPEAIDVVVHPQSIVHSFVEFLDGSCLAQLSRNDMIFPIQYALSYPERWENRFERLALEKLGSLQFEPLDAERFPAVEMARSAIRAGDSAPAVFNAANEVAVAAFLAGEIPFTAILPLVRDTLAQHDARPVGSLEDAMAWDGWGRARARELQRR
jgi:1-deoxy-D-xylulose-5-phosphate reductoisomerase